MKQGLFSEMENLFLALSDRTRLQLLSLMGSNEVSVRFLCDSLQQSQPKISRHLAYLRSAGLVSTRRDGKWIYYGIEPHADGNVARVLDETLRSILMQNGQVQSSERLKKHPFPEPAYEAEELQQESDTWE